MAKKELSNWHKFHVQYSRRKEKKRFAKRKKVKPQRGANYRYEFINEKMKTIATCCFCGLDLTNDEIISNSCDTFHLSCKKHDYLRDKYNKKVEGIILKYGFRRLKFPRTPFHFPPMMA